MGEGRRTLRTGRSRALPAVARRLRSARFYRANHSPTYSRYFSIALSRSRALKLVRVTPSDNLVHERAIGAQIGEVGVDDTVHSRSDKIEKLWAMDFGAKSNVEEGAVVKLGGRYFVITVSTG